MASSLTLTLYGGVGTVTGANFLLESDRTKILVDCGLLQGVTTASTINAEKFSYDPKTVDFLFVTHAHMDHIGRVPKLVREGFAGKIYSTPETREIALLMLTDALKVMSMNAKNKVEGEVTEPLYEASDLEKTFTLWETLPYHEKMPVGKDFSVFAKDAGHILGSAMYEFSYRAKKIVFTGDTGNSPTPLLRDTESIAGADYLIMDSVYGDRNHEPKDVRDEKFKKVLLDTIEGKGTIVMPAFSLERTQVILYELNNLVEDGHIPSVPIYLDSPLGAKVTAVYKRAAKHFNSGVRGEIKGGDDIFSFPKLTITKNSFESREIAEVASPKIIIAGSGMSSGGRVVGHEKMFLPDPNSTILLMGYQALGTFGRVLESRPRQVEIDGEKIEVRARIENITGFSSHKDSDHLLELAEDARETLKKVFVVMGEPKASMFLVQRLRDYVGVDAIYPERGKAYTLEV